MKYFWRCGSKEKRLFHPSFEPLPFKYGRFTLITHRGVGSGNFPYFSVTDTATGLRASGYFYTRRAAKAHFFALAKEYGGISGFAKMRKAFLDTGSQKKLFAVAKKLKRGESRK